MQLVTHTHAGSMKYLRDFPRKTKVVDDCLIYDDSVEQAFYHAWNFLTICATNGIVLNVEKFQFSQKTVDFAGLRITETGIAPSEKILSAIRNFPVPENITDARSWFGLVNQVAWAYSIGQTMQPFRELIKANNTFHWDDTLNKLFEESKETIIELVSEGVCSFHPNRITCLQSDWSEDGLGYLLLQKYCQCPLDKAPVCCPEGWSLVFAGSRCTQGAESDYFPTEGEALSVAWSLEHAKHFVVGCPNLIVATDHEPLLGILNDRDLSTINNSRIAKLKERTMNFQFKIKHCPGKWHRGPDALSRNPAKNELLAAICKSPTQKDIESCQDIENHILAIQTNAIAMITHNVEVASLTESKLITIDQIRIAAENDTDYQNLLTTVSNGFPSSKKRLDENIRQYWEIRDRLSASNNLVLLNQRIVIPQALRKQVLSNLHTAHQGFKNMSALANQTVYWPGMNLSIRNHRSMCQSCNQIAPSQPSEPLIESPPPKWPFQQICTDFFETDEQSYLVAVDRFSCWIEIYHFPSSTKSELLIKRLRELFITFGVPEEISSDGGPQFSSSTFETFLKQWGVHHRLSSAAYPQSNGRAKLAVKSAKRIIMNNTRGSLDNNRAARALLQHRNTPLQELDLALPRSCSTDNSVIISQHTQNTLNLTRNGSFKQNTVNARTQLSLTNQTKISLYAIYHRYKSVTWYSSTTHLLLVDTKDGFVLEEL